MQGRAYSRSGLSSNAAQVSPGLRIVTRPDEILRTDAEDRMMFEHTTAAAGVSIRSVRLRW